MIKAVLFDFGQTLVNSAGGFRAAEKEAQNKIFADLPLSSRDVFLSTYRKIRTTFHASSNFSRIDIWQTVYAQLDQAPDFERLAKWEKEYWQKVTAETRLYPETEKVLKNLAARYLLGMITNTQGQQPAEKHRLNQYPELERFFETIVVAGESGIPPKPDRKPFLQCLADLSIAPVEAVYVGDDWRIDICGAKAAGIRPIWLQHHSVRRNWPAVETTVPIIENLNELLNLERLL
jgi:HAD superfamily hydrolase (TIGR01549 family)